MDTSKNKLISVFAVGFIVGAIIFFFVGSQYAKPKPIANPFGGIQKAVTGKVVTIRDNALTVEVGSLALGVQTTNYTVHTDQNTVFEKVTLPRAVAEGKANPFETKPTAPAPAKLSDILVNDTVTASSNDNFYGQKEFIAKRIELRIYE
ncbi:MAG: hypothetical protein HY982_03010 [Candidatus Magasanikbacteria bacterium]|nr:hypothetical protein [Candidatus Magasanikbacteria bacterium]